MRMILFAVLMLGCFFYALVRGGWPERIGALVLIVGSVLTVAVNSPLPQRYTAVETSILIVDVGVLFAYLGLAIFTDRFWPLWTTALQVLVVLAHVARLADPDMFRNGYGFILAFWSYLQILVMTLAIRAHHKEARSAATRF